MADHPTSAQGEDYLLERKSKSDLKDLLKTFVAFANTVRPGHVAAVLIGERNDGTPEDIDVDSIQKTVRKEADKIYPQIIWRSKVYENAGKQCVRVEIEYSGDTPHFGGPAWVRKGSESVIANVEQFQRLIDVRSGVVRELDRWIGKVVTIELFVSHAPSVTGQHYQGSIEVVNQFFATIGFANASFGNPYPQIRPGWVAISYPLNRITISWDDLESRLKLIVLHS